MNQADAWGSLHLLTMYWIRVGRWCCLVAIFCFGSAGQSLAQTRGEDCIRQACDKICSMPLESTDNIEDAWRCVQNDGYLVFLKALKESDCPPDSAARIVMERILNSPPEDSARLFFAVESLILPGVGPYPDELENHKLYRQFQLAAGKIQLELMQIQKVRSKLYRMVVWRGRLINSKLLQNPGRLLLGPLSNPGNDYEDSVRNGEAWWYLRDFCFIAMALDRDDLVEGITIEDGEERVRELARWLDGHYLRMKPSDKGYFWQAVGAEPEVTIDRSEFLWHPLPDLLQVPLSPISPWPPGLLAPLSGAEMPLAK